MSWQSSKAPFVLQKDTFKNRRTAALLRLIKQGASLGPLFFHVLQRSRVPTLKAYGPQTIRATAIPTGPAIRFCQPIGGELPWSGTNL